MFQFADRTLRYLPSYHLLSQHAPWLSCVPGASHRSRMCSALHLLFHFRLLTLVGQIKLSALQAHGGAQQPFHKNRPLNPATFTAIYHLGPTHTHTRLCIRGTSEKGPLHLNKPLSVHFTVSNCFQVSEFTAYCRGRDNYTKKIALLFEHVILFKIRIGG